MQDSKIGKSHTEIEVEIAAAALEQSLLFQFIPNNAFWIDTYASLSVTFNLLPSCCSTLRIRLDARLDNFLASACKQGKRQHGLHRGNSEDFPPAAQGGFGPYRMLLLYADGQKPLLVKAETF